MSQKSKFWGLIDQRVRLTLGDQRVLVGVFIAFDKHLNVVLADTEEYRVIMPKKKGDPEREIKRPLGLLIIRGDNIVSVSAEKSPHVGLERTMTALGPAKAVEAPRPVELSAQNLHTSNGAKGVRGLGVQE